MGESQAQIWFDTYFKPCAGTWGEMYEVVREHLNELDEAGPEGADAWFKEFGAGQSTAEMQNLLRSRLNAFKAMFPKAEASE